MKILIQDDDGFIAAEVSGGVMRGSFDAVCRAYEALGNVIDSTEYEAGGHPSDYQPEPQ